MTGDEKMDKLKVYIHRAGHFYYQYVDGDDFKYLESFADVVTERDRSEPMEKAALVERMKGAEIIFSVNGYGSNEIDNAVLEKVGTVKYIVISHWWEQFKDIDAGRLGIKIVEGSNGNTVAVAEWVLGVAIFGMRNIAGFDAGMKSGVSWWDPVNKYKMIRGKKVGLVGMGRVGRYCSRLFNTFGCDVVAFDKYISDGELKAYNVGRVGLDELFATCDVISLHLPVTPETTGMMGAEHFSRIKDGAIFINSARAALYDEPALIDEIRKNRFAAYLDVYSSEPLSLDSPLRSLPNVTITPHIAGSNSDMYFLCVRQSIETMKRYADTGEMLDYKHMFP
jgi:phosphoglycerate dehydrogenase-like enzyme